MGDRVVIFVPEDGHGSARRFLRECHEYCRSADHEIEAVTANPANAWIMLDQNRAEAVVVARAAHLRWLVRDHIQVVEERTGRPARRPPQPPRGYGSNGH